MRTPIMAANWKMHKTVPETMAFLDTFMPLVRDLPQDREIIIAPPFTSLETVSRALLGRKNISVGAQNMHFEEQGAFTGEISPLMLSDLRVKWVILGHSERRHVFGEEDELIAKKITSALAHDIKPILCIGETLEEREAGKTLDVLQSQLAAGLGNVSDERMADVVIAYEPVWAIGTGKTATPAQAQEAHEAVRAWVSQHFNSGIAEQIRILYGGSVKPGNVEELMALEDVDGALVGGAALDPESFAEIATCSI